MKFQSTPLMRGETFAVTINCHRIVYFNPLPSCEGRLPALNTLPLSNIISIHSPHARGDAFWSVSLISSTYFNPLPSCEGRHRRGNASIFAQLISIHSPHARGDELDEFRVLNNNQISIHSPHARGDVYALPDSLMTLYFNPLPSCEGRRGHCDRRSQHISIHSPHARGDKYVECHTTIDAYFNPLPSCEGRLLFPLSC